jgi:hypothetical protein
MKTNVFPSVRSPQSFRKSKIQNLKSKIHLGEQAAKVFATFGARGKLIEGERRNKILPAAGRLLVLGDGR